MLVRSAQLGSLLSVSFLLIVSGLPNLVFADDTSGNISVQVTKLDDGLSYVLLMVAGVIVVIALAVVTVLLYLRRMESKPYGCIGRGTRSQPARGMRVPICVPDSDRPSRYPGDYYTEVFTDQAKGVAITDEKSGKPANTAQSFTAEGNMLDVDRYLKEDERIVLNVLRMKHNSCTQSTLRVVTDFSKAKLSRLLSELEERGVIYKEQQGRKNLVTLRN